MVTIKQWEAKVEKQQTRINAARKKVAQEESKMADLYSASYRNGITGNTSRRKT